MFLALEDSTTQHMKKLILRWNAIASINQSIKIYKAPLQDTYSEALPTQAKRKRTVFRRWWNWEQAPFGRCLRSTGSPFQVVGPTTANERVCIAAERANRTTKFFGWSHWLRCMHAIRSLYCENSPSVAEDFIRCIQCIFHNDNPAHDRPNEAQFDPYLPSRHQLIRSNKLLQCTCAEVYACDKVFILRK